MTERIYWGSFEEWKDYGVKERYEERNPKSLEKSKNKTERSWYFKGYREGWTDKFLFRRLKGFFGSFEEWKAYGLERGYDERNPVSLHKSKDKTERSWHTKGVYEGWLNKFLFARMTLLFGSFEEWKAHGLGCGYDKRNPASFKESKNKTERSWYHKGLREGWSDKFPFKRRYIENIFKSFEEWKAYGLERGYDERNPTSIQRSKDKTERSWYTKGINEHWIDKFSFTRKHVENIFKSFEEWKAHGLERGYDERSPVSLHKSKNKTERSWYHKGLREGWSDKFPFARINRNLIHTAQKYAEFIRQNPLAAKITALIGSFGEHRLELESILMDVYDGRFDSLSELSPLVDASIAEVLASIPEGRLPRLRKYMGDFEFDDDEEHAVKRLNEVIDELEEVQINPHLSERFLRLLKIGYGPSFNKQPKRTLSNIKRKIDSRKGSSKRLYNKLRQHYEAVISLEERIVMP